jgi:hypothetical protein
VEKLAGVFLLRDTAIQNGWLDGNANFCAVMGVVVGKFAARLPYPEKSEAHIWLVPANARSIINASDRDG